MQWTMCLAALGITDFQEKTLRMNTEQKTKKTTSEEKGKPPQSDSKCIKATVP